MSESSKKEANKRMSDGFQMIIGDEVVFDSEAETTNTKSKVGTKVKPIKTEEDE
jgi:hypothetical protein